MTGNTPQELFEQNIEIQITDNREKRRLERIESEKKEVEEEHDRKMAAWREKWDAERTEIHPTPSTCFIPEQSAAIEQYCHGGLLPPDDTLTETWVSVRYGLWKAVPKT